MIIYRRMIEQPVSIFAPTFPYITFSRFFSDIFYPCFHTCILILKDFLSHIPYTWSKAQLLQHHPSRRRLSRCGTLFVQDIRYYIRHFATCFWSAAMSFNHFVKNDETLRLNAAVLQNAEHPGPSQTFVSLRTISGNINKFPFWPHCILCCNWFISLFEHSKASCNRHVRMDNHSCQIICGQLTGKSCDFYKPESHERKSWFIISSPVPASVYVSSHLAARRLVV